MQEDDATEEDGLEEEEDWMTPEERLAFEQAMEWGDRARKLYHRAKEGAQDALSELVSLVKQGDKYAHGRLFDLYKEHHKDAKQRYIKIAAEGCAQAQFNVASRLRFGGESGDEKKALWWAELSAAQGFTRAQALLGVMYYFSETDYNKDLERQRVQYKETGNVYYLNEEKKILRSGYIKQDLDLAFKLFTIAATAEKSNRYSTYMLGKMYENGEGCVKDMETAVYWYKQFLTAPHHDPRDDEQPLDFWIDGGS
ncbi:MAG: hypothetical protein LBP76_14615, partial [Treponema sp.]|nr:hypothetical protein [Treponema sp.]